MDIDSCAWGDGSHPHMPAFEMEFLPDLAMGGDIMEWECMELTFFDMFPKGPGNNVESDTVPEPHSHGDDEDHDDHDHEHEAEEEVNDWW